IAFGNPTDDRYGKFIGDFLKSGDKSTFPIASVFLNHWHRVTSVGHLWENDQLGSSLFGPSGKISNFGNICLRIAERARDLSDGNFHSIVILIEAKNLRSTLQRSRTQKQVRDVSPRST